MNDKGRRFIFIFLFSSRFRFKFIIFLSEENKIKLNAIWMQGESRFSSPFGTLDAPTEEIVAALRRGRVFNRKKFFKINSSRSMIRRAICTSKLEFFVWVTSDVNLKISKLSNLDLMGGGGLER